MAYVLGAEGIAGMILPMVRRPQFPAHRNIDSRDCFYLGNAFSFVARYGTPKCERRHEYNVRLVWVC